MVTTAFNSPVDLDRRVLSVALAGNPNAGKTTLFNALTGLRQKVANYPGITVEKKTGRCRVGTDTWVDLIDLPGTYSLVSQSPDEAVAAAVLRGTRPDTPAPDVVIAVIDASNLPRNLYLVSQLIELGRPLVIALNMVDIAERRGTPVDTAALARELGVEVVPLIGNRKRGIEALKAAITRAVRAPVPTWPLPEVLWEELQHVAGALAAAAPATWPRQQEGAPAALRNLPQVIAARRLLSDEAAPELATVAAIPAVASTLAAARKRVAALGIDPMHADIEARYRWIDGVAERVVQRDTRPRLGATISERVDAVLMHRVFGLIIFAAVMAGVFATIFWVAAPLNGWFEGAIAWLGESTTGGLTDGPLKALLRDGVFAGVGAVVVFVPQIALLFLLLAVLEDSGYLARAAFLMDRVLGKVGLHGKSFIPLLSSFACAIPGIMATRTIDSRRERLATILVAPFMSCSARLPVYGLLIGAFFAGLGSLAKGMIMLGCYALGVIVAAAVAWGLKLAARKEPPPAFILELPVYKLPQASLIGWQVWTNTSKFLTKAGTTIFCLSILLWALAYYPRAPQAVLDRAEPQAEARVRAEPAAEALDERIAAARERAAGQAGLEYSAAGRVGHAIEPVIAPLGFDWKIGVGLVGAFAAREVFNSTLSIIYSLGAREADDVDDLASAIRADTRPDGTLVWRPLVAVSLLVWFVLAMQCISTTAVVRRETGGWRWPLIQLGFMNALAYILCFAVYQIGTRLGY